MSARANALLAVVVAALLLAGIGGVMSYQQVEEGHAGVEWYLGDVTEQVYEPGPHFINPLASVQHVEIRPRTCTMSDSSSEGGGTCGLDQANDAILVQSINGTEHNVDVTIRYRIASDQTDQFVAEWNNEAQMERRLIRPTVRSQMRDEAAAVPTGIIYRAEGRERLAEAAYEALSTEFQGQPIILEAVQVRDVTLPSEYAQELEQREVAKAEITRRQHEVEVERREAERKRVEAEANADVIEIEGEAIRDNPEILTLRYIEAINPTDKVIIGGDGGTPVILDASGQNGSRAVGDDTSSGNVTASEILGGG